MRVCALASGSSGNCFFIENENHADKNAFLIDVGISAKQVCSRLESINKNIEQVKAIFVTHEHSDHIRGIDVLARKFNIPIFAPKKIASDIFLCSNKELINDFKVEEEIKFAGMNILPFSKSHLSLEPVSYFIQDKNKKLSVITDAGHACANIVDSVADSDFLCIESNYDENMLENGFYPKHVKDWIRSDKGHLSNMQSSICVVENAKKKLKNVMLCHISQNNNTPKIAQNTFEYMLKQRRDISPNLHVSLRSEPSGLFKV